MKTITAPKPAPKKTKKLIIPKEYTKVFNDIKNRIKESQVKAILAANKELINLYYKIGQTIYEKQKISKWGSGAVEKLSQDIQNEFPDLRGFSRANLFKMQAFFMAYEKISLNYQQNDQKNDQQFEDLPIFSIPWGHNIILLAKMKDTKERLWYAQKTIEYGWSRSILEMQIESQLHKRQGKAITNFKKTLPTYQSDLAQQSFKDPYVFDFMTLKEKHLEKDLERSMIKNVEQLLLELGKGFALVSRQQHIEVGTKDFYIDLLFYHTKLKCYVVVELKAREFQPGDVGQINFYLSAVDDILRDAQDNPTIGLLLCKTKDNISVEYALRGFNGPIGVAEYETKILKKLPKRLKSDLPTIEEFESEFDIKESIKNNKEIKNNKKINKIKKLTK